MKLAAPPEQHTLWVGMVAVLAPLLLLLGLQYRWLIKLDQASGKIHKATLNTFLEGVSTQVEYLYRNAEPSLDLPADVFTQNNLEKAAVYFKKKVPKGAKRLFVVSFVGKDDEPLYFEPSCSSFSPPKYSSEVRAVWAAISPWQVLAHKGAVMETVRLTVDERDPNYRMLILPITDDSYPLLGLAGMILDEDYFRQEALPQAVKWSLTDSSPDGEDIPVVSVRDEKSEIVYINDPLAKAI